MILNLDMFYHPFNQNSLSFFVHSDSSPNESSLAIMDDVELYQQPVEKPNIAILFFFIRLVFTILAAACNYRVIYVTRKDNGILNDIIKLQAYIIMTSMPIRLIFITLTDLIHPLNEVLGQWICSSYWITKAISSQMMLFHSLFIALIRYVFVVHNDKVVDYGKEKMKKLFWYLIISIPIFNLLWIATDLTEIDTDNFINRCNGADHKKFLIQSWSSLGLIKKNFESLQIHRESDKLTIFLAVLRRISKVAQRLWIIFLASNITDGIIYYKLIQHMRR